MNHNNLPELPNIHNFPKARIPGNVDVEEIKKREFDKIIPKTGKYSFGGIIFKPAETTFANQNPGEKIYVLVRQFWIVNAGWVLSNTFYIFLPIIFFFILQTLNIYFVDNFVSARVITVILIAYYSLIFTNIFKSFVDWYFDVFIITNQRVLDYEFKPMSGYKVKEAMLEDIQDVKEKSLGPIASIFDYGNLEVKTASERGVLDFEKIPNPTRVRDILTDLSNIARKYSNGFN